MIEYLKTIPRNVRAWLDEPSDRLEACPCNWAPELGVHHRVRRRPDLTPAAASAGGA